MLVAVILTELFHVQLYVNPFHNGEESDYVAMGVLGTCCDEPGLPAISTQIGGRCGTGPAWRSGCVIGNCGRVAAGYPSRTCSLKDTSIENRQLTRCSMFAIGRPVLFPPLLGSLRTETSINHVRCYRLEPGLICNLQQQMREQLRYSYFDYFRMSLFQAHGEHIQNVLLRNLCALGLWNRDCRQLFRSSYVVAPFV